MLDLVASSLRRSYVRSAIGLGLSWNRYERMLRHPVLDFIQISSFGAVWCRILMRYGYGLVHGEGRLSCNSISK
jgi:hypothetical protein